MDIRPVSVESILDLRHAVLRAGLPRSTARFEGDDDPGTIHLAAIEADRVVGCVTLIERPLEGAAAWQLRGMAVAPDRRGAGVGRALLEAVRRELARRGDDRPVWCHARVPAIAFYEAHGWRCVSGVFDVPTAGPHRRMRWVDRARGSRPNPGDAKP